MMTSVKDVLVGVELEPDGESVTAASQRAALQARWLAERVGARVTLLNAEHVPVPGVSGGVLLGDGPAVRGLEELLEDIRSAGVEADLAFDPERPWLALARRAAVAGHDLVVVGQRNELGGWRRPLGTNTFKLLRKCPAPVWVVHPTHALLRRSVLVASDLTDVGRRALAMGGWLADQWGAGLHVVHALDESFGARMSSGLGATDVWLKKAGRRAQDARAKLAEHERELPLGVEPKVHLEDGPAAKVILEVVERVDPDLVVMGTVSRSGIPGLFVGNTAERLMHRLDRSLLAIKPLGFHCPVGAA